MDGSGVKSGIAAMGTDSVFSTRAGFVSGGIFAKTLLAEDALRAIGSSINCLSSNLAAIFLKMAARPMPVHILLIMIIVCVMTAAIVADKPTPKNKAINGVLNIMVASTAI